MPDDKNQVIGYSSTFVGYFKINKDDMIDDLPSSLVVPKIDVETDLSGLVALSKTDLESRYADIVGISKLEEEDISNDIIGSFEYIAQDYILDLDSIISIAYGIDTGIEGTVSIETDSTIEDLDSVLEVKEIDIYEDIEATANIDPFSHESSLGSLFTYEQVETDTYIEGTFDIETLNYTYIVNSRLMIPYHVLRYSIWSKLKSVYGLDTYIDSKIDVINDQIYELNGKVQLDYAAEEAEIQISAELPPFILSYLDGVVELEGVNTRRDIESYMYAANRSDSDIESKINVCCCKPDFYSTNVDIATSLCVGNYYEDMFISKLKVQPAIHYIKDLQSKLTVIENTDIGRIAIFVDPLWRYEPFVLKNAVSTLLDRIMLKERVTLVYGGSPRANYDIKKYASIYRILKSRTIEVPFEFIPGHPLANRGQMNRFVETLFSFLPNEEFKIVNKVFIFSDNPYAHNSTYLTPLFSACNLYHIPITVITSKGDHRSSGLANFYDSRNEPNTAYPIENQPHWVWGAGSKHRDIYNSDDIV